MQVIDANVRVTVPMFDTKEYANIEMSAAEALNVSTEEGCPQIIEAIPIDWIKKKIEEHRDNSFQDVFDAFQTVLFIWKHETEGKK